MVYASIACPFLAVPDYERKTAQRGRGGALLQKKGAPRGDVVLAGAPTMVIVFDGDGDFKVLLGGGQPRLHRYRSGDELLPVLDALLATPRAPDQDDLDTAALLATENEDEIVRHSTRVATIIGLQQGLPLDLPAPNDPCGCGSGLKFRRCCGPVITAALAEAAGEHPSRWSR